MELRLKVLFLLCIAVIPVLAADYPYPGDGYYATIEYKENKSFKSLSVYRFQKHFAIGPEYSGWFAYFGFERVWESSSARIKKADLVKLEKKCESELKFLRGYSDRELSYYGVSNRDAPSMLRIENCIGIKKNENVGFLVAKNKSLLIIPTRTEPQQPKLSSGQQAELVKKAEALDLLKNINFIEVNRTRWPNRNLEWISTYVAEGIKLHHFDVVLSSDLDKENVEYEYPRSLPIYFLETKSGFHLLAYGTYSKYNEKYLETLKDVVFPSINVSFYTLANRSKVEVIRFLDSTYHIDDQGDVSILH